MRASPQCNSGQHATCPGYYLTTHPCECACHLPKSARQLPPKNSEARPVATTDVVVYNPQARRELCSLLGIEGTATHIDLLFKLAEHYGLDVLTKEIHLIPKKGPFIGVWGRLHIAQRSGRLDGLEMDDEYETDKHHCVRVVVWRNDMRHPAAKVIGRVGKHERKDWPTEIARARGLRAALGYAFSIHDSYDTRVDTEDDDWTPPPDERFAATVLSREEETTTETEAGSRHVDVSTGEVHTQQAAGTQQSEVAASGESLFPLSPSTEGGHYSAAAPATPDKEPATVVVGGHTLAQKLAMAARDAGIDDDETRHEIIQAASGGRYARGADIGEHADPDVVDRIYEAFSGIASGTVELRYHPDGTPRLVRPRKT